MDDHRTPTPPAHTPAQLLHIMGGFKSNVFLSSEEAESARSHLRALEGIAHPESVKGVVEALRDLVSEYVALWREAGGLGEPPPVAVLARQALARLEGRRVGEAQDGK